MKLFGILVALLTLIPLNLSHTCLNGNILNTVDRFLGSSITSCLRLTEGNCSTTSLIPALGKTCGLLYVDTFNGSGSESNSFMKSGRCTCLDSITGSLVLLIDINPNVLTDLLFQTYILNALNSFYYSVTQNRLPGSLLDIKHLFLYGDSFLELNVLDILTLDLSLDSILNPVLGLLGLGSTNPCSAIKRAIDILNTPTNVANFEKYLFYWGFSTPDLTGCLAEGRSFLNTEVYALRQALDVNLNGIEDLFGSFSVCNWYQPLLSGALDIDDLLQVDLIIGSLSDFLCSGILPSSGLGSGGSTTTTTASTTSSLLGGLLR